MERSLEAAASSDCGGWGHPLPFSDDGRPEAAAAPLGPKFRRSARPTNSRAAEAPAPARLPRRPGGKAETQEYRAETNSRGPGVKVTSTAGRTDIPLSTEGRGQAGDSVSASSRTLHLRASQQLIFIYLTVLRGGNGTPLQYSRLANPMDGGAW